MSGTTSIWVHCGGCETLFSADREGVKNRRTHCPHCHELPWAARGESASDESSAATRKGRRLEPESDSVRREKRRQKRIVREAQVKRKTRRTMMVVGAGWVVVLLVLAVFLAEPWENRDAEDTTGESGNYASRVAQGSEADESTIKMRAALPVIQQSFGGFLKAQDPAEQAQFVFNPTVVAPHLMRAFGLVKTSDLVQRGLSNTGAVMLRTPQHRAIETLWVAEDGGRFDAIFFESGERWLLDWEQFVRRSSVPWGLFLAGGGEDTGEFRLLMRERGAVSDRGKGRLSVEFYAPTFGAPEKVGRVSPEFDLEMASLDGRILAAALDRAAKGESAYESQVGLLNPPQMTRVRVRIHRETLQDGGKKFSVESVLATHWMGIPDVGVDLDELSREEN